MKTRYCAIMWNGRDRGTSKMNHHQPHQRLVFIQRWWCCIHGGIRRESSITNSFWKIKWLIARRTAPSQTKWKQYLRKSIQNRSTENTQSSIRIMQDCMFLWWYMLQLGWEVLIHLPYSPDTVSSDVHLFQSLKNCLNEKYFNYLEDSKRYLEWLFDQKDKKSGEDEVMKLLETSGGSGTKQWIGCSIKFLVKMKNVSFIFNFKKSNELFGQLNTTEKSYLNLSVPQFPHGKMRTNSG